MKATKKIVGAACALVAAVALSAGSTFAWFSSNGTVNATGMQVNIKTDNSYLAIARASSDIKAGLTKISLADVGGEDLELLPSAYEADSTLEPGAADNSKLITNASQWYTAQGKDANDGTIVESTKHALVETKDATGDDAAYDIAKYVVSTDLYVGVLGATGVEDIEMIMKVGKPTDATTDQSNAAMSIVILYRVVDFETEETAGPAWSKVDYTGATAAGENGVTLQVNKPAGEGATATTITESNYVQVKVLVYFNGAHADVYTANQLKLTGITLDFAFTDGDTTPDWTPGNQTVPVTP